MRSTDVAPELTELTSVQVPPAGGVMAMAEPPATTTCARSWSLAAVPAGTASAREVAAAPAVLAFVAAWNVPAASAAGARPTARRPADTRTREAAAARTAGPEGAMLPLRPGPLGPRAPAGPEGYPGGEGGRG